MGRVGTQLITKRSVDCVFGDCMHVQEYKICSLLRCMVHESKRLDDV